MDHNGRHLGSDRAALLLAFTLLPDELHSAKYGDPMPELAEVETVRLNIEKVLKGNKIVAVTVDATDSFFYAFAKAEDVRRALTGATVTGSGRRGKYFWLELNRKPSLVLHLGMTGSLSILIPNKRIAKTDAWEGVKIWNGKESDAPERLWFSRLILTLKNGTEIAIRDPRRFGRVWLSDDPSKLPRIARLGPDPLIDFPSAKVLAEKLKKRRGPIKAVLLDQRLFAGVGNWLADEILYQARLSPHRSAAGLTSAEIKKVREKTLSVCKTAVAVKANYKRFPATWIFAHRWGKSKNAKVGGQKIIHEEIGGRTTAWVPTRQS